MDVKNELRHSRGAVINDIREQIKQGFGVVPLVGSGMSAASGIPAGRDYQAYLFYCLAKVFGTNGAGGSVAPWDPSELRWPLYAEVPTMDDVEASMLTWSGALQGNLLKSRERADQARHDAEARWQATGAVADWRATLHLLSRLSLSGQGPQGAGRWVRLRAPDPRVVDSFFVNLTEGKKPNTAHRLLAHLADVLRVKVILTTNFDNLIETAFQRLDMPTVTFDVHNEAGLPDARLVRARRSVVKLHGERYGLRADFTLDMYPSQEDIDSFLSYVSVYYLQGRTDSPQRHLLIMGVSGRERRTVGLVAHALCTFGDAFRVYWVCHRQDDTTRIVEAFRAVLAEVAPKYRAGTESLMNRIRVTSTPNLGLFLLELYQNLFLCLPPAGVSFDVAWPVPPPCAGREKRLPGVQRESSKIVRAIEKADRGRVRRPLVVTGPLGTPIVATETFYALTGRVRCIWLELTARFDSADFVLSVLGAMAREVGGHAAPPFPFRRPLALRAAIPAPLRERLKELSLEANRRIVLFVNARHFPGAGGAATTGTWSRTDWEDFARAIDWFSSRITVVVLARSELLKHWRCAQFEAAHRLELGAAMALEPPERVARVVTTHIAAMSPTERERWRQFVFGLTLFRHPCYLSALQSWALQKAPRRLSVNRDNDTARFDRTAEFLESLRAWGAVRDDEGQSVFMYPALQRALQLRMLSEGFPSAGHAEAHQGIADWYVKLYRASDDILAALESIAHRLRCIDVARPRGVGQKWGHDEISLVHSAINEMGLTVELMRPVMTSSPRPASLAHLFGEILEEAGRLQRALARRNTRRTRRHRALSNQALELSADPATFSRALEQCKRYLQNLHDSYFEQFRVGRAPVLHEPLPPKGPPRLSSNGDEALLQEVARLANQRAYAAAEACALEILRRHDISSERLFAPQPRPGAREWVRRKPSAAEYRLVVGALRRLQQVKLYQAEIARLNRRAVTVQHDLLMNAEEVYTYATEVMRYLDDVNFLQEENAMMRANTGILLSWMNRHQEAHRRYSEAYGYLSYVSGPYVPLRFATVDLRRGETFLCQLAERNGMDPRQQFGLVYDAVAAVERAGYKVADTSVRTRWYAWLHELELSTCCEIAQLAKREPRAHQRFAQCRSRVLADWFVRALEGGKYLVTDGSDPLRLARYIDLSQSFITLAPQAESQSSSESLCEEHHLKHIRKLCDEATDDLQKSLTDGVERDEEVLVHARSIAERWLRGEQGSIDQDPEPPPLSGTLSKRGGKLSVRPTARNR